ncbi:MAG: hypothetical protein KGJ84_13175 [Elusimicrobia bacterium]|nr:hypothetical protein [Elusimicrobiota bacterium]
MPLPALVGLILLAAAPARAQNRAGLIDAAEVSAAPSASAVATLSPPSAIPSLIAAPALAPAFSAPSPAAPAPAAVPAALAPAVLAPSPLQASALSPAPLKAKAAALQQNDALPANLRSVARLLDEAGPGGTTSLSDAQLVSLTQRLAGEGAASDFSSAYLRPERPFDFGASETFRYRTALSDYKSGASSKEESTSVLLASAFELARSAGIEVEHITRASPRGGSDEGLRVLPRRDGSLLNRLAYDLERRYGAAVEYVPARIAGGVAAYNSGAKVLFLPDFGRANAFEAILHETAHAQFTDRLARGALSPFHGLLLAYEGRAIAPGASSYVEHMSLEEISTHGKELKHQLAAARAAGTATTAALLPTYTFLYQYADVLRSARLNLAIARSYVGDRRAKLVPADEEPAPFPGGRWYRAALPYGFFYIPVREEAAPKRGLFQRAFTQAPETAAEKALRRRADALLPAIAKIDALLADIESGIKADRPDLKDLNARADRIVAALREAETAFAAGATARVK